jgi:hypothetical protein
MNVVKPYDHQAVEWRNEDGYRECLRCPTPITGIGPTLRHVNEAVRPAAIDPADRAAVDACVELGTQALADMWTNRVTDRDRARVVVERLHAAGRLDTSRRVRVAA